jgi:GNAT superfamily N-acetyltransferase
MQIREMSLTDLLEVSELAQQLGYPSTHEDLNRRFSEIEGNKDYGLFVATSSNGKVLGYVQINFEPKTLLIDTRADIAALVVSETSRSQGIGAALLKKAEEWAKKKSISLIRVRSNLKRQDAHRFYVREGYTLSKTSNQFTKHLVEVA